MAVEFADVPDTQLGIQVTGVVVPGQPIGSAADVEGLLHLRGWMVVVVSSLVCIDHTTTS